MAWSNAARAAALAARKAHARAKAAVSGRYSTGSIDARKGFSLTSPKLRKSLAASIRRQRKFGLSNGLESNSFKVAASSTRVRNMFFGGAKRFRAYRKGR